MEKQEHEFGSPFEKYFYFFLTHAKERALKLRYAIIGDLFYEPQNKFAYQRQQKILAYLKSKTVRAAVEPQDMKKKYTNYDPEVGIGKKFNKLSDMKESLLRLQSNIDAAEEKLQQLKQSDYMFKTNLYNEAAYEYDRQRYSGLSWGLVIGALICSTLYRKGNVPRQGALFVTCGHLFGQINYHLSMNKYFDTVYKIFEEDAQQYLKQQEKQTKQQPDSAGLVQD